MNPVIARTLVLLLLAATTLHAQVPQLINYQGRVAVGAVNFEGSGQFKFALVNANGTMGTTTWWSNDGTSTGGSEPTAAVTFTVSKGPFFSVLSHGRMFLLPWIAEISPRCPAPRSTACS